MPMSRVQCGSVRICPTLALIGPSLGTRAGVDNSAKPAVCAPWKLRAGKCRKRKQRKDLSRGRTSERTDGFTRPSVRGGRHDVYSWKPIGLAKATRERVRPPSRVVNEQTAEGIGFTIRT